MTEPTQPGIESPLTPSSRHRFAFGGVAFEVLAGDGVVWELPEACIPLTAEQPGDLLADVLCSVRTGHVSYPSPASQAGSASPKGDELRVASAGVSAEIRPLGAHRYALAAVVEPEDPRACEQVLALASSVVARLEHARRLALAAQTRSRG